MMNKRWLSLFLTMSMSAVVFGPVPPAQPKEHKSTTADSKADTAGCSDCVQQASALFASGKNNEAVELLESWRSRCPKNAHLRLLLSTILIRSGTRMADAEQAAREAATLAPESLAAQLQYGLASMANKDNAQAKRAFEAVVAIDPNCYEAWSSLGEVYRQLHEDDKAKAASSRAAEIESSAARARQSQFTQPVKTKGSFRKEPATGADALKLIDRAGEN